MMYVRHRGWVSLSLLAGWLSGSEGVPEFGSPAEFEQFLFPRDAERISDSLKSVFRVDHAGVLVSAAGKVGPGYASQVAGTIPDPEFQRSYRDLAKYLDRFGPCQKTQMQDADGWWSNYPGEPFEGYCGEVTKLVWAKTLWNQVHYCRQLATGESKPKVAVPSGKGPPYRLDEPPVQTVWIQSEVLYALADAAVRFRFEEVLRRRAAAAVTPDDPVRRAAQEVAAELETQPPNRERIALALAKLMISSYEALHLQHLRALEDKHHKEQ